MQPSLIVIAVIFIFTSCGSSQTPMKVNANAKAALAAFIKKPKFESEPGTMYVGVSKPELKAQLNNLINKVAVDFSNTVNHQPTEAKFQNNIGVGLARFNALYLELDTEDRERVGHYFEELMDCVGLQSSKGQLNTWMYGFDPAKAK